MTAKQKAEELLANFGDIDHLGVIGDFMGNWEWSSFLWKRQAKEASIKCVDEILETIWEYHLQAQWWQEVKQEINKL
jgi:hypothetical protein